MAKEGQGFLTFAIVEPDGVDYLRLAYLQALNVKATQTNAKYAVITNVVEESIPEKYKEVFDYIIHIVRQPDKSAFFYEPFAFDYTPFKETIKLEADLLFTRSIDHWWTAFRLKDVCLSYQAKTFRGISSRSEEHTSELQSH